MADAESSSSEYDRISAMLQCFCPGPPPPNRNYKLFWRRENDGFEIVVSFGLCGLLGRSWREPFAAANDKYTIGIRWKEV